MTAKPKQPTAFARLCNNVKIIVARSSDMTALQNARLSAIEDRLAALDGGHNAARAQRTAIVTVNAKRAENGQAALGLRMGRDGESIEWCGSMTTAEQSKQ